MPLAFNIQPPLFETIKAGKYVVARHPDGQFQLAYVYRIGVGQFDVMWWDDSHGVIPHHAVLFCGYRPTAQGLLNWLDRARAEYHESREHDRQAAAEAAKAGLLGAFRAWLSNRRKRRVAWAS